MEILVVTPELAPYTGQSELAETTAALAKSQRSLGHRVVVALPLYRSIDPSALSLARRLTELQVRLGDRERRCQMYDGRTAGGVDLLFLGEEELFAQADPLDGDPDEQDALRAMLLGLAAMEAAKIYEPGFDVLQAQGWQGALAVVAAKRDPQTTELPAVLALHDLRQQGRFPRHAAERLGLDAATLEQAEMLDGDALIAVHGGIARADRVIASSATHLHESAREHAALGKLVEQHERKIVEIPDGIDASTWNPAIDVHLPAHFEFANLTGKAQCKAALQEEAELPARDDIPLLVATGDLDEREGGDLLAEATEGILQNDVQLFVAATRESPATRRLAELQERFSDRLQVRQDADDALLHRAIGAGDFLLLPSRREASGLRPRAAQSYGTLPVARRTGALADAAVDCDAQLRTGSGFLFDEPDSEDLLAATRRAVASFAKREAFEALRRRIMQVDRSWDRSGRRYEHVYQQLTGQTAQE